MDENVHHQNIPLPRVRDRHAHDQVNREDSFESKSTNDTPTPYNGNNSREISTTEPVKNTMSGEDKKVLEEKINQNVERAENGKFKCTLCGKEAKQKIQIQYHIEGVHMEGLSLPCSICGRTFRSRNAFTIHKFREHKV